jgi:hypothetical protein
MGRWQAIGCASIVALSLALSPKRSRACVTPAPPNAWVGYPTHGLTEVPTDVVLYYNLFRSGLGEASLGSFQLTSESGDVVALTAKQTYGWSFELFAGRQLEPQTTYTLTLAESSLDPLVFTTGDGPVVATPEPPQASLTHYKLQGLLTSCDPQPTGTCVGVAAGLPVVARELGVVGNVETTLHLYTDSWRTDLTGENGLTCVRLWSRAPNGSLSASVDLCGDEAPQVELEPRELACTATGIPQRDNPVDKAVNTSESCSFSARKPRFGIAAIAMLVPLLLGRRRRRFSP